LLSALLIYRSRNLGKEIILTIFFKNPAQFARVRFIYHLSCAKLAVSVHAHIQGRIFVETKAALGFVDLMGRYSQIKKYAVYGADLSQRKLGSEMSEIAFYEYRIVIF